MLLPTRASRVWVSFKRISSKLALLVRRRQKGIVAMVNSAQTSGSHGTTNVIALKADIQALTCQRA
jgi:hypothetical protein